MSGWIDDRALSHAANTMADAFRAMYDDNVGATVGDAGNAAIEASERHRKRGLTGPAGPGQLERASGDLGGQGLR